MRVSHQGKKFYTLAVWADRIEVAQNAHGGAGSANNAGSGGVGATVPEPAANGWPGLRRRLRRRAAVLMRSKNARMVAQFRRHFGLPVRSFPDITGVDFDPHGRLLAEELAEIITAMNENDAVEILDGLADLV